MDRYKEYIMELEKLISKIVEARAYLKTNPDVHEIVVRDDQGNLAVLVTPYISINSPLRHLVEL
jgi:hypothetical protein